MSTKKMSTKKMSKSPSLTVPAQQEITSPHYAKLLAQPEYYAENQMIMLDIPEQEQLADQLYRVQQFENLGMLASSIAHDLNNVLTPILTLSQLLRSHQPNLDARSQQMLQVIEDSARRGANLTQQILTFTRETTEERSPIQISSLLQEVHNFIQSIFPKSISIQQNIPDQPLWFTAVDSIHLYQICLNLCINARDAMPNGGTLTLSVENGFVDQAYVHNHPHVRPGNYVVLTIADTGTGIPPEVCDRIFEPFFTTKQPGQGTGLGLATVLGIVQSYGGFLQVFSQVGQGTVMKVYLPALEEPTNTN